MDYKYCCQSHSNCWTWMLLLDPATLLRRHLQLGPCSAQLSSYSCLLVYMNSMNRMTICVFTECCKSWNKTAIRCHLKLGPCLDHCWILSFFSWSRVNSMTSINTCWSQHKPKFKECSDVCLERKGQQQVIFLIWNSFFCCFIKASSEAFSEGVKQNDVSTEVGVCSNWENWRFRRHRCAHYFQLPTAMFSSKHPNNCLRSFCLLSETADNPFLVSLAM